MLDKIRVILIQSSHPGNIGSTARSLKNMGLSQLYLVSPLKFPSEEATAYASNARDLLDNAKVVSTLEQALVGCTLVLGTSGRSRSVAWPTLTPREAAQEILQILAHPPNSGDIALLFGREQHGLSNEELECCHYQISIPANPAYPSLNIAQAVQVISYEIYSQFLGLKTDEFAEITPVNQLATADEMALFFKALETTLVQLHFLDLAEPRHLMSRLRRLFGKARVSKTELNILRGILTAIQKQV
jgi:tRNA (cytidine32/uridine32-2'-O)-methyltransferase